MAKQTMVSGTQLDPVQKVIINNNRLYFELHVTKTCKQLNQILSTIPRKLCCIS